MKYHTLNDILEKPELIKRERLRKLITENRDSILRSYALTTVDRDVPLDFDVNECIRREPDWQELLNLFSELEFGTFLKLIPPQSVSGSYETVLESGRLKALLDAIEDSFAFNVEFSGTHPVSAEVIGISFSSEKGRGYYVPVAHHYPEAPGQLDAGTVLDAFRPLYENESIRKIGHDLKAQLLVLRSSGIDLKGELYDTMVASYLLNPNKQNHSLEEVSLEHLSLRIRTFKDVVGKRSSLASVSIEEATEFSASNAAVVMELEDTL
ncbi:MAG: hypothetical protein GXO95_02100 [Nitrospirae bacterium]|nr:hypothetical protein [Nitrospirota bacterium]